MFSSDLSQSIVDPFTEEPPLSPLASERTPYLRNLDDVACRISETTCYTPLATATGPLADVTSGQKFGGEQTGPSSAEGDVQVEGATPDLQHVVLESAVPLKARPENEREEEGEEPERHYPEVEEGGIYEWSASSPPARTSAARQRAPRRGTGRPPARRRTSAKVAAVEGDATRDLQRRLARRVVDGQPATPVPARHRMGQTIQLDQGEADVGHGPKFQTASADGSTIFFTDEQALVNSAGGASTAKAGARSVCLPRAGVAGAARVPDRRPDGHRTPEERRRKRSLSRVS